MKFSNLLRCISTVFLVFSSMSAYSMMHGSGGGSSIDVKSARDINSHPHIFETNIEAAPHQMTLPTGETATVFAYNGQVPGPKISAKQGDRVIVHFTNNLPEGFPSTIHWHGIELNNKSDGTPATQDYVYPGESYTYDFIVPRGGVFWYHPHVRGGQEVIAGLYGPLIVEQPEEAQLKMAGVLPKNEKTLVLSDISFDNGVVKDVMPDVILLDIRLPGIDGYEVAHAHLTYIKPFPKNLGEITCPK